MFNEHINFKIKGQAWVEVHNAETGLIEFKSAKSPNINVVSSRNLMAHIVPPYGWGIVGLGHNTSIPLNTDSAVTFYPNRHFYKAGTYTYLSFGKWQYYMYMDTTEGNTEDGVPIADCGLFTTTGIVDSFCSPYKDSQSRMMLNHLLFQDEFGNPITWTKSVSQVAQITIAMEIIRI